MRPFGSFSTLASLALLGAVAPARGQQAGRPQTSGPGAAPALEEPLRLEEAPFVASPPETVGAMLRLARVGSGDVVYDLGCGDGRIAIAAVRDHGARRAVCVESDAELLTFAREDARLAGVEGRIQFLAGDLFSVDLREATVVTLYLLQSVNLELRPKLLRELRPGTRVVSHRFHMGDWRPDREERVLGRPVYLWTLPTRPSPPGEEERQGEPG
jgi:SAM-dependent methyltransferase